MEALEICTYTSEAILTLHVGVPSLDDTDLQQITEACYVSPPLHYSRWVHMYVHVYVHV